MELPWKGVEAWCRKGRAYAREGQYDRAVECYDRVLEVNPDDTGALKGKAAALINLDQPVEAAKCYMRLQRLQRG